VGKKEIKKRKNIQRKNKPQKCVPRGEKKPAETPKVLPPRPPAKWENDQLKGENRPGGKRKPRAWKNSEQNSEETAIGTLSQKVGGGRICLQTVLTKKEAPMKRQGKKCPGRGGIRKAVWGECPSKKGPSKKTPGSSPPKKPRVGQPRRGKSGCRRGLQFKSASRRGTKNGPNPILLAALVPRGVSTKAGEKILEPNIHETVLRQHTPNGKGEPRCPWKGKKKGWTFFCGETRQTRKGRRKSAWESFGEANVHNWSPVLKVDPRQKRTPRKSPSKDGTGREREGKEKGALEGKGVP